MILWVGAQVVWAENQWNSGFYRREWSFSFPAREVRAAKWDFCKSQLVESLRINLCAVERDD